MESVWVYYNPIFIHDLFLYKQNIRVVYIYELPIEKDDAPCTW